MPNPDWRPTTGQILWAIRIAIVLGFLIAIGYAYGVTLRDWAERLIVPALLAAFGLWLSMRFNKEQQRIGLLIEDERAEDAALQAYLDQMGQLLLDKDPSLQKSTEGDEVRTLARVQTLTVLERLSSGRRKASVLRFLYESGLIYTKDGPIIDLREADFSAAHLERMRLPGAHLKRTNLQGAHLGGASLRKANLVGANLKWADLVYESPPEPDGIRALHYANLSEADLRGADLRGAEGISNEQLDRQAGSLEGATMPNGQDYEDWRKSKGRGEDGENSGP